MPVTIPHMNVNQEDLVQVASLSPECYQLKLKYDKCFEKWFSRVYLKKKSVPNMTPCAHQFKDYVKCVQKAIHRMDINVTGFGCPVLITEQDHIDVHAQQKKLEKLKPHKMPQTPKSQEKPKMPQTPKTQEKPKIPGKPKTSPPNV